jgi:hypothetical protein
MVERVVLVVVAMDRMVEVTEATAAARAMAAQGKEVRPENSGKQTVPFMQAVAAPVGVVITLLAVRAVLVAVVKAETRPVVMLQARVLTALRIRAAVPVVVRLPTQT